MSQSTDPEWDLYRTFHAAMTEGSFSGAARVLGLTQPTVNRHIDTLEAALGLTLFSRSQRGLIPTDAALELRPFIENIAVNVSAMRRAASGHGVTVRGTVRITASEIMGAEVLPPILAELNNRHPELVVEMILSNRVQNLLQRDADIAVRMLEPAQDSLLIKRVGTINLSLHAHRRYLERRGMPRTEAELEQHSVIGFDQDSPFSRQVRKIFPIVDRLRFAFKSNSDLAQLASLRAGYGICLCQRGIAARDPDLVPVLPGLLDIQLGTWVVMHEDMSNTPRCRATFDALVAGLTRYTSSTS